MKRQVIQDFLTVPGIAALALIDSRNRPFFCGLDICLNSQQQAALARGIQQVVETTPANFDAFSFRFSGRQAHIYKLQQAMILLVITTDQVPIDAYLAALAQLKTALTEDTAFATFRLLAGCVVLGSPDAADSAVPADGIEARVQCEEMLAALNHLSDFAAQYLGKVIVSNAWRAARPNHSWLTAFEIDCTGHFQLAESAPLAATDWLPAEQHQRLKEWVQAFMVHCSRVIRDFAAIACQQGLDSRQQALLLSPPSPP